MWFLLVHLLLLALTSCTTTASRVPPRPDAAHLLAPYPAHFQANSSSSSVYAVDTAASTTVSSSSPLTPVASSSIDASSSIYGFSSVYPYPHTASSSIYGFSSVYPYPHTASSSIGSSSSIGASSSIDTSSSAIYPYPATFTTVSTTVDGSSTNLPIIVGSSVTIPFGASITIAPTGSAATLALDVLETQLSSVIPALIDWLHDDTEDPEPLVADLDKIEEFVDEFESKIPGGDEDGGEDGSGDVGCTEGVLGFLGCTAVTVAAIEEGLTLVGAGGAVITEVENLEELASEIKDIEDDDGDYNGSSESPTPSSTNNIPSSTTSSTSSFASSTTSSTSSCTGAEHTFVSCWPTLTTPLDSSAWYTTTCETSINTVTGCSVSNSASTTTSTFRDAPGATPIVEYYVADSPELVSAMAPWLLAILDRDNECVTAGFQLPFPSDCLTRSMSFPATSSSTPPITSTAAPSTTTAPPTTLSSSTTSSISTPPPYQTGQCLFSLWESADGTNAKVAVNITISDCNGKVFFVDNSTYFWDDVIPLSPAETFLPWWVTVAMTTRSSLDHIGFEQLIAASHHANHSSIAAPPPVANSTNITAVNLDPSPGSYTAFKDWQIAYRFGTAFGSTEVVDWTKRPYCTKGKWHTGGFLIMMGLQKPYRETACAFNC